MNDEAHLTDFTDQNLAAPDDALDGESGDVREARIADHVAASMQLADPLQATLGAASGDLLLLQLRLHQALDEAVVSNTDSLAAITDIQPVLNSYLKLTQQLERFVHLGLKVKASASRAQAALRGDGVPEPT